MILNILPIYWKDSLLSWQESSRGDPALRNVTGTADRLFLMTGNTPAVHHHLGRSVVGCFLQPLSVAFEAVLESELLMHLDHLRIFAVADIAA